MNERDKYPNLPADVSLHHCTKNTPMPIEIADKLVELKQLWTHDDADETEASKEIDGSTMWFSCPHCGHHFSVYVGD